MARARHGDPVQQIEQIALHRQLRRFPAGGNGVQPLQVGLQGLHYGVRTQQAEALGDEKLVPRAVEGLLCVLVPREA